MDIKELLSPSKYKEIYSLYNPYVRIIVLSEIPAGLAAYLFSSFLPLYIKEIEARMVIVSIFFSLQGIFNMVFAAVSGWQVDRHNRALLQGVFTFLFSGGVLIIVAQYGNPFLVVAGLIVVSLSVNIVRTARYSLIVDFVPTERRSSLFGLINGVGNIFSIAGGVIGGYLLLKTGFTQLFVLISFLVIAAGILRFFVKDPKYPKPSKDMGLNFFSGFKAAYKAIFANRILTFLICGDIFIALGFSTTFNFYGIYFKDVLFFDYSVVGLLISIFYSGIAVASFAGSIVSDRIGHEKALAWSVLINALFIFAFIHAKSFFYIGIIYFVLGMTGGVYAPNFFTILGDYSPEEHRGKIYSIQSIHDSIFLIVAPPVGGFLWDRIYPLSAWYVDLGCTIAAGCVFLGLLLHTRRR
ncbi:MAG: MFS transporter [Theionarchaea archaeon]|nr:MFS transporter [Theionarchaea archaeon]